MSELNKPPLSQEKSSGQAESLEQSLTPPRWLSLMFKIWAVLGFVILSAISITIVISAIKTGVKLEGLEGIDSFVSYVVSGLYAAGFIGSVIYTIVYWGAFKLRKWVIPLLLVLSFFSVVNAFAILFLQPVQQAGPIIHSLFSCLIATALAVLAYINRRYFIGTSWRSSPQVFFLVIALPALLVSSLSVLFPDLPDFNDADIVLHEVALPPKEGNAYFVLIEMNGQVKEPAKETRDEYDQFLEGTAWNQGMVDATLAENEDALKNMRYAVTFPYYQCPSTAKSITINTELCPLSYLRGSAKMAGLSALSSARKGDFKGAIDDALMPVRIGQLLIDAPRTTLIDYLVGIAMKNIGLKTLNIILTTYKIPSEILLPQIAEMEKYVQNEDGLKNSFRAEYMSQKSSMAFIRNIRSNFYLQPNRSFAEMAEDIRQRIILSGTQCYRLEQAMKDDEILFEKKNPKIVTWKLPFIRNAIFEVLRSVVAASLHTVQTKRCETTTLGEQTRLEMALSAYKYDKGEYPASQSALVPTYIPSPILNPLNNEAFMFNKDTGKIL